MHLVDDVCLFFHLRMVNSVFFVRGIIRSYEIRRFGSLESKLLSEKEIFNYLSYSLSLIIFLLSQLDRPRSTLTYNVYFRSGLCSRWTHLPRNPSLALVQRHHIARCRHYQRIKMQQFDIPSNNDRIFIIGNDIIVHYRWRFIIIHG